MINPINAHSLIVAIHELAILIVPPGDCHNKSVKWQGKRGTVPSSAAAFHFLFLSSIFKSFQFLSSTQLILAEFKHQNFASPSPLCRSSKEVSGPTSRTRSSKQGRHLRISTGLRFSEANSPSVSKYGLNQWARVSSLLARKTPKQCKARWMEWLDPSIRKIEWSKEEDEKLLHLAKLMPTQWRSIAPRVGRTATQCLERYQKLLDEAEARENEELDLAGPEGGENKAPSADDVRKLRHATRSTPPAVSRVINTFRRPGELDPDPESKPAKPDTIDLDEDEKEMLSEARARLANTQGKKAKRKARERQLEESRRLASLQKRRELKTAGINIKINTRKPGQMDYNADVPFEKAPAPGFYDTVDEETRNERQREMFDPRKQQLANKRKTDQQEEADKDDRKRQKKDGGQSGQFAAAAQAGKMQKIREAERSSKRKALVLPEPQVGEGEVEEIVKMGRSGEKANQLASETDSESTLGLVSNYSSQHMMGATPLRTPLAPQEEDRVANEIRNARARTETQSALLGGENLDLEDSSDTTGYEGAAPTKQALATPNPLGTPLRQTNGVNGTGATPMRGAGLTATPGRTPRDNFQLNEQTPSTYPGQTPREAKLAETAIKTGLRGKLASLPKPKETDWEFELPDEQSDATMIDGVSEKASEEDAAERDARNAAISREQRIAEFKRQTQVYQRGLPRPTNLDIDALLKEESNPVLREAYLLIAHDARLHGDSSVKGGQELERFTDEHLANARSEITLEVSTLNPDEVPKYDMEKSGRVEPTDEQLPVVLEAASERLNATAKSANDLEKHLAKTLGGYQARAKTLRSKIVEADEALRNLKIQNETRRFAAVQEQAAGAARVEELKVLCDVVKKREGRAQDEYARLRDILNALEAGEKVDEEVLAPILEEGRDGQTEVLVNGVADAPAQKEIETCDWWYQPFDE